MKKNSFLVLLLAILCIGFNSCKKDEPQFILRSTDEINFDYKLSTTSFTVRSNGNWTISADSDWFTVDQTSGVGDGVEYQTIAVTAARNMGSERKGSITIHAGGKDAVISLTQKDGHLIFKQPIFSGTMAVGKAISNSKIQIPFTRAAIDQSLRLSVVASGEGSDGILPIDTTVVFLGEEGTIELPVTGFPTTIGDVTFSFTVQQSDLTIESVSAKVTNTSNTDPVGTVYFSENFDKMVWGGDQVGQAAGVKGGFKDDADGKKIIDESIPVTSCTQGTDGSNDLIATMAESYRVLRGFSGWSGLRIYERPGYIKISTASSKDGNAVTPALAQIQDGAVNVKVTFKTAKWSTSSSKFYINILNAGVASVSEIDVDNTTNWVQKEFTITGTTSETKIQFSADATQEGRFFLDEIKVVKIN